MDLVRMANVFVRDIQRTDRRGSPTDRSIVRDYSSRNNRHFGHMDPVDIVRERLAANCIDGMDCRRDLRDRSKLDFVKRRMMHRNRMDLVRMDFSVRRNLESYSDFRCSRANMCISRIHCSIVCIVCSGRTVMDCMNLVVPRMVSAAVFLRILANRSIAVYCR